MRAMHDLGGVEPFASQPIDQTEHELSHFDKSVDALMYLLSHPGRRIIHVDELRRAIESLTAKQYESLGYYEKWLLAMRNLLIEKQVLTPAEIEAKLAALRAEGGR
jgi:hypothetical protein